MSFRALNWAFALSVKPPGRKLVLICLADYAVETNLSYPSMQRICEQTSMGKDAVEAALESLMADEIIKETGKRAGEQKEIRVWQLNQEADTTPAPKKKREPKNEETAEALKVYEIYPRRVARPKALVAIARQIKVYGFEIVMNGTKLFAEAWRSSGKTDLSFCPHATTFFNGERFNDSPEGWGLAGGKKITTGPTYQEVFTTCREKEEDSSKAASYATGFYATWKQRGWKKDGREIEWRIELQNQIARWRTEKKD